MRILLIEDDLAQLEPIYTALSQAGHVVDGIQDAKNAQWAIFHREYDLLILDWVLPGCDGLDLCRHYRSKGKAAPVVILTAKDSTWDKVTGLDAGADDYIVKPADVFELLARVRALGRRSPQWQGDTLKASDLTLHLSRLIVERKGRMAELSSREFQLLEYLLRHPQQVLSRRQIEQALWEWGEEPDSNAITTLVRRLRQRLHAVGAAEWLETIYGTGYRLNPI
jgi:two-component system, OmpR family, manganese sensing response regulator